MKTNEELNCIIAKWVGYKFQPEKLPTHRDPDYEPAFWIDPDDRNTFDIPRYCEDINAIHEAEKKLTDYQKVKCYHKISDIIGDCGEPTENFFNTYHATARQRAEALVAVIEGGTK